MCLQGLCDRKSKGTQRSTWLWPWPPWDCSTPYGWYIEALCYGYILDCQGKMCDMIHTRSYIHISRDTCTFCRWFGKGTLGVSQCLCMPPFSFQGFVQTQQFFSSLQLFLRLHPLLLYLGLALMYSANIYSPLQLIKLVTVWCIANLVCLTSDLVLRNYYYKRQRWEEW